MKLQYIGLSLVLMGWLNLSGTSNHLHRNIPSFSAEVFPIIKKKCNQKDCHGVQRANPVYTTYDGVKKQTKRILVRIKNRSIPMPPREWGIVLSKDEIALIETWIKAGAPNN